MNRKYLTCLNSLFSVENWCKCGENSVQVKYKSLKSFWFYHIFNSFVLASLIVKEMASSHSQSGDRQDLLSKLKDKKFIGTVLDHLNTALQEMTTIGREKFQEYDQFVEKVNQFKKALLDYVLDSLRHLQVLQDNFLKKRYQEENDLAKALFIKNTLDKIDRTVLKEFICKCIDLIALTEKLRDKYGGKMFILEHITYSLVSFTVIGVSLGFAVGFVLPAVIPTTAAVGGIVGLFFGAISTAYSLYKNWGDLKDDIQIVRENLSKIKDNLEKIRDQLEHTDERLAKAKIEGDLQYQQCNRSADEQKVTYQDIADLEQYVTATYEAFLQLKTIVLHPTTKNDL